MISSTTYMIANFGDDFKEWARLDDACLDAAMAGVISLSVSKTINQ